MGRTAEQQSTLISMKLILWTLMLLQLCSVTVSAAESPTEKNVAATVNGTVITVEDFQRERERLQRQKVNGSKATDEAAVAGLNREALENIIIRELLYQESIKQKISIDTSAVDSEMELAKAKFASPGQFSENLQRIKLTEAMVRDQVTRGLATRALIDRSVGAGVVVSEDELKKYYEQHQDKFTQQPQVRLSHILIIMESEWPRYNKKEAGDKLSILLKRLQAGEDFATLAKENSDCQSKAKGGDIGWFAPGQLTPEMEAAVAPLKVGDISAIVEDKFGLHVIKVVERKASISQMFDTVRDKIRSLVRQDKGLVSLQRYVKGLRDGATVEIRLTGE
jgi:parvulin-like peptidyl-prolyl isomerase